MEKSEVKPGDVITCAERVWQRYIRQPAIALVTPVFGAMVVYEFSMSPRPDCVRTGRENPMGVQAHYLEDWLDPKYVVRHYPLHRALYVDEEDRLLETTERCLGLGVDSFGFVKRRRESGYAADFVAHVWRQVGLLNTNQQKWCPIGLLQYAKGAGIVGKYNLLT